MATDTVRPAAGGRVLLAGDLDWRERVAAALTADGTGTWTVLEASSLAAARDHLAADPPVRGVVAAADFDGGGGLALLEHVRERAPDLPFVLYAAEDDGSVASAAVAAGVDDYVVDVDGDRLRAALASESERGRRRRRARQFEALFDDPNSFVWVLAPDGRVRRANATAHDRLGHAAASDGPFWTLPWWASADRLREAVERAAAGDPVQVGATAERDGDDLTVDLSIRPVTGAGGAVRSLVVEGIDTTERTELERELRQSEELHRVTLSNMTDTVLLTDDEGAFTYVCPNVHFIFGYSAEEIYDLGTIDALLGTDLFDRDELAERGVLTNVECTTTDKAGREHTLLVNVREVAIQDGTVLYSCRDITKRKQRERALTVLHDAARALLYAETREEIARIVADEGATALDLPAAAVYLFEAADNALVPAASSEGMEALAGMLPELTPGDGLVGTAFVGDEAAFVADVHRTDRLADPSVDLRSGLFIPLADHGVLVAGSDEPGAFGEVTHELADLLAATAEAALDRVEREAELRSQERTLQERNRQLTRVDRINDIIREIDQALIRAETRAEIEHAVCDRLTANDRFAFAWIGAVEPAGDDLSPTAWAGRDEGYLDVVDVGVAADDGEPAGRTAATREPTVVPAVADDLRAAPWRREALARDYQSVVSVPLVHDEVAYGTLTVYATRRDEFDETAIAVLEELAETIASAIASVERRNAMLSDEVVELTYEIADSSCAFCRLATQASCSLELEGSVQREAGGVRAFVGVEGDVDAVLAAAADSVAVDEAIALTRTPDGGLVELRLSAPSIATTLADHGAVLRSLSADPDRARVVVEVPGPLDVRTIDEVVSRSYPESTLLAQHEGRRASESWRAHQLLDRLTDRQREVVQAAYHAGYFASPRERTGEEVAAALDISPAAFYSHVRAVQRKVFDGLFAEAGPPADG
ncbi:MAG: bacterio-opsin activator domain-containing protein [Haloarculaceae archaeon]